MKKLAAVILTLSMTLGLAACGAAEGASVDLPGNATTGYRWFPDAETEERFGELPADYIEAKSEGEASPVGAGGLFRFTISPLEELEAGAYEAGFLYYRPWEGPAGAVQQAAVPVTVAKNGSITLGEPEILSLEEAELPEGAVRVELPGNASTGYSWQPAGETAALFGELPEEYLDGSAAGEEPAVGVPGAFCFIVAPSESRPLAPGSYELEFLYYRPWEGEETAEERARVPVTVAEDGSFALAGEPVFAGGTPGAEGGTEAE